MLLILEKIRAFAEVCLIAVYLKSDILILGSLCISVGM
jgi:hypothetical protein